MLKSSQFDTDSDDDVTSPSPKQNNNLEIDKNLLNRFRRLRNELFDTSADSSFQDMPAENLNQANQASSIINSNEATNDSIIENKQEENREENYLNGNLRHHEHSFTHQSTSSHENSPENVRISDFALPLVMLREAVDTNETSTQDEDDSIIESAYNNESLRRHIINIKRAQSSFSNRTNSESSSDTSTTTSSTETSNENLTDNSILNNSLPIESNFQTNRYRQLFKTRSNPIPEKGSISPVKSLQDCGCFPGLTGIGIQGDNQFCFHDPKNSGNVLRGLNELRSNKLLCDIVLKVKDEEFYCHKCVLASLSSYFRAMFNTDFTESKQSKVCLNELEPNTMKLIIDYAYTSILNINENNVQALLSSANLFDIKPLREACCRYMQWRMDEQNCIGIYCFSDTHCCNELKEIAFKYILNNFIKVLRLYIKKVVQHEEYLALTPPKLIDIIKNDNLKVESEDYVYEACIKWLEHSAKDRIILFHKILEHVRLPLLKPYFLYDKVQNNQLLKQSNDCSLLIKEAFDYNFLKDRRNQIQNLRTRSRKYFKHLESLIIICGENDEYVLRTVEAYLPSLKRWLGLRHFPFSLTKSGVVATEETILFIAGGERSDLSATDSFWQYNSILDEWKELQNMQTHRTELGLAIVDGCVYAIGGKDLYGSSLDSVECYDPLLNIWKYCAVMTSPLVNPAVCSLNGLLYVMAGSFNQYYNPSTNTWTEFQKPQVPRLGSRACGMNGKIYLIGGYCDETTNLVESYDPVKNKWERCASMIEARRHPGVAILNNQIFVCGGENSSGEISNTIEAYDLEKNQWEHVTEMRKERSWLSCASLRLENPLAKSNEETDSISNSVC